MSAPNSPQNPLSGPPHPTRPENAPKTRTRDATARCNTCRRTWNGTSQAHCSGCHQHFAGASLFDRHRRDFECLDPAAMHTKAGDPVYTHNEDGSWSSWINPNTPRPEHWNAA